ncbi:hypothetical protein [Paenarthrobacter nitroguajacolicus]|uniref:hypothetical protein n=1 Tax=Paenarthrobacter nitroguajacolicus TaxID=211146 RepID=UPI00248BAD5E|nr:hypothetical protein [Paenarthrobacter nitroguajacolicus]MDI2033827.1 hypothetical protein [Paenarthrobacter nitroguajacolicus]
MKCPSRSHLVGLALVPVLMLALSACLPPSSEGLSPQPGSGVQTSGTPGQNSSTAGAPTAAQPAGPAGPAAPQENAPVVRWIPVGPVGPNDPTSGQRYLLLQQFQCDSLARSVEGATDQAVWLAGAAVCRAVQSGSKDDWEKAANAVSATPRIPQNQCLEFSVAAMSASLVAQYRSNPGAGLKVEPGLGEACPRQLSGLTVVDEELRPVPGTPRASGPSSGGTIVRLDGYYVRVGEVLFDGVPADVEFVGAREDYGTLYLRMPPAQGRTSVRISVTDTVDISGAVTFFYDDAGASGTTGTGTASGGSPLNTNQPPTPASVEASPTATS